jgi:hypothetical protein
MFEYKIVFAPNLSELERKVGIHLNLNWQVAGGPFSCKPDDLWCQAMIRKVGTVAGVVETVKALSAALPGE